MLPETLVQEAVPRGHPVALRNGQSEGQGFLATPLLVEGREVSRDSGKFQG